MEKYKYVIIDDEYPSHWTVQQSFKRYPNYTCVGAFYNPEKALIFLQEHKVDLIFLDMEMQEMNGFEFLEALERKIFVVILTAYFEKHGLNAHQYYFNKDLVFFSNKAQFLYYFPKIIEKFEKMYLEKELIDRINQLSKNEILTFPKKANGETIPLTDIIYIEAIGHHVVLKMKRGDENIFRMSIKKLMGFLPADNFLLIKRNIIINVRYVTAFTESTVCLKDYHFSLSTRRREEAISVLNTYKKELYKDYCLP